MTPTRYLTGIKPTGHLHIGNYFGAIKPAISNAQQHDSFLFIADYHALTTCKDATALAEQTRCIAAAWLALGLNPDTTCFYKQSDIPEIFELAWILSCFCPKGLLNRAHAYKALSSTNSEQQKEPDWNINTGIFTYPVLMAADILLFKATHVPVGIDQKQHIEIARDMAVAFNKKHPETFVLPTPVITEETDCIPGIDGQKMSKNYNNTLPLFASERDLRKACMKIVTDSTSVTDPKNPDTCSVFGITKYFLSVPAQQQLRERYLAGGTGYGVFKQELYDTLLRTFKTARATYNNYMENPTMITDILAKGHHKARTIAQQNLASIRTACGL